MQDNSYLNDRKAIDRLKREYQEYKSLIIGFDFDCTIFDFHKEDLNLQPVIDLLAKCSDLGFTMCLHSLTDEKSSYYPKVNESMRLGIRVDFINESPVMKSQNILYNNKPFYSILLDSRAGLSSAYNILSTTLNELNL